MIVVPLETLATLLHKFVDQSLKKNFHENLQSSTNFPAKNVYSDEHTTFKSLNSLSKMKDIAVLAVEKESCVHYFK